MRNKNRVNIEDVLADHLSDNNLMEVSSSSSVFRFFWVVSVLVVVVAMFQIINLGLMNNSLYERLSLANATYIKSEAAPRGLILDRYGDVIVGNSETFRAYLSPEKLPRDINERNESISKVGEALSLDPDEIRSRAEDHDWHVGRLLLDDNLSHDRVVRARSLDIPALEMESAFRRVHSVPKAFSHIVGYAGLASKEDLLENSFLSPGMDVGKIGLELAFDDVLSGKRGEEVAVLDAGGAVVEERVSKDPVPGEDLETFLDKELQEYFYERLNNQIKNLGSRAGVGIVMDPGSGEILSMVNIPGFDNNNIADFLNLPNSPFLNRAIAGRYSPGSVIKPLVAIAALEEGLVSPQDRFFSSGRLVVENPHHPELPSVFHDWKPHGWVDLHASLAVSSNVYYYIVGGGHEDQEGLGISRLKRWWKDFGLGDVSGIDIPGEKPGVLPDPEWKQERTNDIWRLGDTYNVSIGQGDLELTPIAILNYINVIANGGVAHSPRISKRSFSDIVVDVRDKVSESSLREVHQGLVDAVARPNGTAFMLSEIPMKIAGKTGSAQVSGGQTNAFFVGYGPSEDPEISIFVMIEGARDGSLNVVPVARDVLMWYYENRQPTTKNQ